MYSITLHAGARKQRVKWLQIMLLGWLLMKVKAIGAGAVQTSKRYYEGWLDYKLQTMVNKA